MNSTCLPTLVFHYLVCLSIKIQNLHVFSKSQFFGLFDKKGEFIYHCQLASICCLLLVGLSSLYIVPKGMCYSLTVSSLNAELITSTFKNKVLFYNITTSHFVNMGIKIRQSNQILLFSWSFGKTQIVIVMPIRSVPLFITFWKDVLVISSRKIRIVLGFLKFFLTDLVNLPNLPKYWYLNYLRSTTETTQNHKYSTI